MRALLLHPEDSPRRGPWLRQRWDLVVDLGKSSGFSRQQWKDLYQCPLLGIDIFRKGIDDVRRLGQILTAGEGQLVDEEGIDWWDLSLRLGSEMLALLPLQRIAVELPPHAELWATRADWQVGVLGRLCRSDIQVFGSGRVARVAAQVGHYSGVLRRFSSSQIQQIFLDKYDSSYRWRSRFANRPRPCGMSVVLLPSAYVNVSRMAAAYANLLPDQPFLLVAARASARQFDAPKNVQVRELAAYVNPDFPARELDSLFRRWTKLLADLQTVPELRLMTEAGILQSFPAWLRDGVAVRNAWREVLEREPVCGILCGDDSNMTTRLPVLLGSKRGIATTDFHHGAFDGRYLLKKLASDLYLTKGEMERDYLSRVCGLPAEKLMIAAPRPPRGRMRTDAQKRDHLAAVFFSEPYELAEMRPEEVYREIVPPLANLAREHGRSLIIKLHPFESRLQRTGIVRNILSQELAKFVTVIEGPLTAELMSRAWFGVTVESTAVIDCFEHGVNCFLCAWLTHSPYGYLEQYSHFRAGEILNGVSEFEQIPAHLDCIHDRARPALSEIADPAKLQEWLTSRPQTLRGARSA